MPRKSEMSPEAYLRNRAKKAEWKRANPEKVRMHAKKYRDQRRDQDPEAYLSYLREASKKSYARRKALDPEALVARNRENHRLQLERNPERMRAIWRAKYRAKHPLPQKSGRDLFAILQRGIPKSIPHHIRDDVIGEMALGLADGRIKPGSIGSEIRGFITAQYRHQDYHRVLSLDSPLPGKEGQSWVDALESDVEHF